MSLRSPFARRVRLAFHRLGIPFQQKVLDVFQDQPELWASNPLGSVPTLKTEFGTVSDSNHILEYLDEFHGKIWPINMTDRIQVRQASVLAAGIMQNTVLYYQETKLHEVPSPRWVQDYLETIQSTLASLSQAPDEVWHEPLPGKVLTQAAWDLGVALEYLDLRIPSIQWRTLYPEFLTLLDEARKSEEFCHSTPPSA